IPVYAEMGSVNPVFLLPSAVEARGELIAEGLSGSITMGVGQFCTSPGLVLGVADRHLYRLVERLGERMRDAPAAAMLHAGICSGYRAGVDAFRGTEGVHLVAESGASVEADERNGRPALFATDGRTLREQPQLQEEVFGPVSLVVAAETPDELIALAEALEGQLTASVHGTQDDLLRNEKLVRVLERKAGRLIFNGFPTGVEVGPAMHHGGPYPATTDARSTSVGTAAILRFARPVAYQAFPEAALPAELGSRNERGIWRMLDGEYTRDDLSNPHES
ncbi:MAG: aldehyde dehydrogenase family protein, partial [Gemmatimonadetes bacterium]|nr:aldehyde dehydrogenase family protein [Gemmatimonadota bacterium]